MYFTKLGFVRYNKTNMPCQCGYPDEMSLLVKMVFARAPPSGKPSFLWETFHQHTHNGMAHLYNGANHLRPSKGMLLPLFRTNDCIFSYIRVRFSSLSLFSYNKGVEATIQAESVSFPGFSFPHMSCLDDNE